MTTGQAVLGASLQINHVAREVWDPELIPRRLRNRQGGNCLVVPSSWGLQRRLCCAWRWRVQLWRGSRPTGAAPGLMFEKGSCQRAGHAPVSWIHKLPVTGWGSFPAGKAQVATETISSSYLCWLNALPMLQGPFLLSVPCAGFLRPSCSPSPFRLWHELIERTCIFELPWLIWPSIRGLPHIKECLENTGGP